MIMNNSRQIFLLASLLALAATTRCALAVNPVLNIKETFPYLIDRNDSSKIIEPRDYMDFENLYAPSETYKAQQTIQGRNYYMLKAFDFANYFQSDYWHYSSDEDLRRSALPVANELVCAQQLDWLERQILNSSDSAALYAPGEQHVQLASFMDSFGRPQASTYLGHAYWLGSYYQCLLASIDADRYEAEIAPSNSNSTSTQPKTATAADRIIKTRYCVGKARELDWPADDNYVPRISYKVGLCLPETCQTLSVRSQKHRRQIERLMQFNMPEHVRRRITLDDMYCLPDKRSPIRELSLSGKIFLALLSVWLIALLVSTALYSCLRRHQKDLRHLERQMRRVDLTAVAPTKIPNGHSRATIPPEQQLELTLESPADDQATNQNNLVNYIIHQANQHTANLMLSKSAPVSPSSLLICSKPSPVDDNQLEIIEQSTGIKRPAAVDQESDSRSVASSCDSSSSSLSAWLKGSPALIRALQALSITENVREFARPPKVLRDPRASLRLRINMNALDAIKCLCCVLVVFGHIVFIHMQHMTNIIHTIELSHDIAPRVLIAFFNFVDTFFIISGMLTTYFIFKRFNKGSFSNPIIWLTISLFRLIRLSPVYLLVFWFVKTLSIHLSEGPLWDYGTDKNSIKGLCINDHWWKSLLYLGNWGTMQPLCILPAWSIIVDAQYSLFVPPIIFLIFRHKRLGYLGLLIAVIISTGNMSYQLATQTAVKTSDMAKIRLHVYPLISRFAAEFYNTAWNRLGPIAVGILGGHMLYLYDIGQIRRWPFYMRGAYFKFILILHMLIFILPTIGRLTEANPNEGPSSSSSKSPQVDSGTGEPDMLVFILSNATIKPIWSVINTIFLLRLITDLRQHSVMARLASHNIWHCLGKLCFSSYLIHYEIILILLKSRQDDLMEPSWCNIAREFSLAFLISTIVAYFIYVLFEAPINKLIMLNIDKSHLVKNQSTPALPPGGVRLAAERVGEDQQDSDGTGNFNISDTPTAASGDHKTTVATTYTQQTHQTLGNYRYECVHDKRTKEEQLANMA